MIRTLNFTSRQKIMREEVELKIETVNGRPSLNAKLKIKPEHAFPGDAKVIVEIYHRQEWQRFDYGTVAVPLKPDNLELKGFGGGIENLQSRVKIIANGTDCKLLGLAQNLSLDSEQTDSRTKSLFDLEGSDAIGNLLWDVDFGGDKPTLRYNNKIFDKATIRSSLYFRSYVLAQAFEQVLIYTFAVCEDEPSWADKWKAMVSKLPGVKSFPAEGAAKDEFVDWAKSAAEAFSSVHDFVSDKKKELNK